MYQTLHTKRLELRLIKISDKKEIFFLRTDKNVNKYIKKQTPENMDDVLIFINKIINNIKTQQAYYWCITKKGTENVIGTISLWNFSEVRKTAEVGYDLNSDYHGKGIMSETLETSSLIWIY